MKKNFILHLISLLLIVLILGACSSNGATNDDVNGNAGVNSGDMSDGSLENGEVGGMSIEDAWASSAHANNYVADSVGNNNSCAQCHAPINWMPSMDDIPESCFTCKFEIADPEPFIPEANWMNIPCKQCHKLDKKDNVEPEIYWLAVAQIDEYESVESADGLCTKCHSGSGNAPGHLGIELSGVHSEDLLCVECHDPHSTTASCGDSECHDLVGNAETLIVGHDEDHASVSCMACHDGGEVDILKNEDGTWDTAMSGTGDEGEHLPSTTHNVVVEVDCGRCHYSDNPWGLSGDVAN